MGYVDWGGRGDTILFLPGLGDTLDRFDEFAPSFTDAFHVMGLDRRGQGRSDKPASGYDTTTLANDIKRFLDAKGIRRVILIGHSIAGEEMTRFAGLFPDRLAKLVYLDAANDDKRGRELAAQANIALPKPSDPFLAAIELGAGETHPDYAKVVAPALAFYAVMEPPHDTPQTDEETRRRNEHAFRVFESGQREQINLDGSGLRRLTAAPSGAGTFGNTTRDGSKMTFTGQLPPDDDKTFVFDPRVEWTKQTLTSFSTVIAPGVEFQNWTWSPDGRELTGTAQKIEAVGGALVIYSPATRKYRRLYGSQSAVSPIWLNDGHRFLFQEGSRVLLLERGARAARELLSIAPDTMDVRWSITHDNRRIYFVRRVEQGDIWLMRSK